MEKDHNCNSTDSRRRHRVLMHFLLSAFIQCVYTCSKATAKVLLVHTSPDSTAAVAFGLVGGQIFRVPLDVSILPLHQEDCDSVCSVMLDLQESAFPLLGSVRIVGAQDSLENFDLVVLALESSEFVLSGDELLLLEHGLRWTGDRNVHV